MQSEFHPIFVAIRNAAFFVAFLWLAFFLQIISGIEPGFFGIIPRTLLGLTGIITAPFVHGDIIHLVSNSAPLFVVLSVLALFYPKSSFSVIVLTFFLTGFWVWAAARESSHIGASGVLYGITSFLVFSGFFRNDLRSRLVTLGMLFLYGGMIWGIFPNEAGISFESHLFGAVAGLLLAYRFRKTDSQENRKYDWENAPDYQPEDETAEWNYFKENFPPRDIEDQ